ncbi:hypothetical protein TNCV_3750171 [Trichonephila clavipes]|nr:hypothetical protein TNCV_3750171 [Trichonephila clavipes]
MTSRYKAARGLMVTDLVILKRDQLTRTTSEQATHCSNFHTKPTGGDWILDKFNMHRPLQNGRSLGALGSNPWHPRHQVRDLDHYCT